ncbi:hypothetical protein RSOL_145610, partial [Rhizoctonia solani AG-3 Rhs1AP]
MGKIQRIETRLSDINQELDAFKQLNKATAEPTPSVTSTLAPEELLHHDAGRSPYQIAASQKNPVVLPTWLETCRSDPAVKEFIPRLKAHLLARIEGSNYEEEAPRSAEELTKVQFQYDRIYAHQTLIIRYTTYDVRRSEDTVNPATPRCFVLVPSDTPVHPKTGADRFWYARVLGIYHANVSYSGSRPKRMDFLWVRWLARMVDVPGGWDNCCLDRVGYFPDSGLHHAFEFVDPIDVIRAVHLIPRFCGNQTTDYLESLDSLAADSRFVGDWRHYYVGRFVDRDMLMRFVGMAIGHMTHVDVPDQNSGLSAKGYEYTNNREDEEVHLGHEIQDTSEGEEPMRDGDDEDESDEFESDTDQACGTEDDMNEDISEDVSW